MSAHPSPEQLGAYLDGELDASPRALVDAHLRECAECGAHLVDLSAVDDAARSLPVDVPQGYFDDFAPRVRARLEKRTSARWRPPVWGWAAAAALLLGVITPLALQQNREASPIAVEPAPESARRKAVVERDAAPGFEDKAGQPTAAAPAQAPPATVPVPQAPAPNVGLKKDQEQAARANDLRLSRRDETGLGAVAGRTEPVPAPAMAAPPEPKREAPAPGTADGERSKEKLAYEQVDDLRARDHGAPAAPPPPAPPPAATQQRQHGPRSQGAVSGGAAAEARKAASAPEPKDRTTGYAEPPAEETAAAGADAPAAELQESVEVTSRSRDVGQGAAWAKFRSLADGAPPRSDGDARLLREAWRTFASENPGHPQIDEARVRGIEAGVLAYRLGRRPQDREIALRDGRAYLVRPRAPQAARVRAALKTLEPAAP
jgi:anti-sigma factor RsiW